MANKRKYRCKEYKQDHLLAKLIVAVIVTSLILMNNTLCDILAIWLWLFMVNPLHYFIEYVLGHKHKVGKL